MSKVNMMVSFSIRGNKQILILKFLKKNRIEFVELKKGLMKDFRDNEDTKTQETIIDAKLDDQAEIIINGLLGDKSYSWHRKNGDTYHEVIIDSHEILRPNGGEGKGESSLYLEARSIEDIKSILRGDDQSTRISKIREQANSSIEDLKTKLSELQGQLLEKDRKIADLTIEMSQKERDVINDFSDKLQEFSQKMKEDLFKKFQETTMKILRATAEHVKKPLEEYLDELEVELAEELEAAQDSDNEDDTTQTDIDQKLKRLEEIEEELTEDLGQEEEEEEETVVEPAEPGP
jgi:DNA repair exonuclease SbcCD ATPase subunit